MDKVTRGARLTLQNVSVSFDSNRSLAPILESVSLIIEPGEVVALCGVSGVGKSTLLRVLAGLTPATSGEAACEGMPISGPPEGVGYVVQDFYRSLFPWMSVQGNLMLALRRSSMSSQEKRDRVSQVLREVDLAGKEKARMWELSGGMAQRVAIARALVAETSLLLMDEPFASVDAQVRQELEDLTLAVSAAHGVTTIIVTHDIDEAIYVADRVVVLSGKPATITAVVDVPLSRPRNQLRTREAPDFGEIRRRVVHAMWPEENNKRS